MKIIKSGGYIIFFFNCSRFTKVGGGDTDDATKTTYGAL